MAFKKKKAFAAEEGGVIMKDGKGFIVPKREAEAAIQNQQPTFAREQELLQARKVALATMTPPSVQPTIQPTMTNVNKQQLTKEPTQKETQQLTPLEDIKAATPVLEGTLKEAGDAFVESVTSAPQEPTIGGRLNKGVVQPAQILSRATITQTLDVYNNLRKVILGGDTPKVKQAREGFSMANEGLKQMLDMVKSGQPVDVYEIDSTFQYALQTNSALRSAAKRNGIENLSYWINGGKDIEQEAANNERTLNLMYQDFQNAIMANQQIQQQQQLQTQQLQGLIKSQETSNNGEQ